MTPTPPDDGGPAFPVPVLADKDGTFISTHQWAGYMESGGGGMTLRDWFAGQALAGLCSRNLGHTHVDNCHGTAARAYVIADAMLEARGR